MCPLGYVNMKEPFYTSFTKQKQQNTMMSYNFV